MSSFCVEKVLLFIFYFTIAWFELLACILGVIVTIYLKHKNKGLNSPIMIAEMQGNFEFPEDMLVVVAIRENEKNVPNAWGIKP